MRVRFRIDGVLHEVDTRAARRCSPPLISRLKIMANVDITERRVPQNGRITVRLEQPQRRPAARDAADRVGREGRAAGARHRRHRPRPERSSASASDNYARYAASFTKPHGMVLVTGPTGSGKSTTLYATLTEISKPEVNIITVEDPVEYRLAGVNQVQVNHKAGLTFAAVLPAILRSDPDVVLIGEIRDRATAQLAVEAALTGHLVLSTLHTNDAPSAVTRLIEMGIEPFLVGSSLDCVLAQRLARRLCEWCKEPYTPTPRRAGADALAGRRWSTPPAKLWRPVGCRSCGADRLPRAAGRHRGHAGVRGDRAAGGRPRPRPARSARSRSAEGMVTLREDGLRKAAAGPHHARGGLPCHRLTLRGSRVPACAPCIELPRHRSGAYRDARRRSGRAAAPDGASAAARTCT